MLKDRFKKAREYLGFSQKAIAKKAGLTNGSISRIEGGHSDNPNYSYVEYLVRNGVNYFYLIGESEEIKGQKIDGITRAEHESLQQNFDDLEKNYQELENRYNLLERVLQLLQIEVDEQGNVKQKK